MAAGFVLSGLAAQAAKGQDAAPSENLEADQRADAHFQFTTVTQAHPSFDAPYSGQNSLSPDSEHETTVTATLFLGLRTWKGGELYANPEMSGGRGLSQTFGIAGFPNGEAFRVGSPEPHIFLARVFLRQTFAVGGEMEKVEDDANQLGGSRPSRRWTVTLGKIAVTDIFDDNEYSHDPRTQFLNWADWTPGAWDYPADTRGYTWGFTVEYDDADWAVRVGAAAEPKVANGLEIDKDLLEAHSFFGEVDRKYEVSASKGEGKLILFYNRADMGNYRQAIEQADGGTPDITATRQPGRTKWGFALNFQQEIGPQTGLFLRGSWNDGANEAWAYAEIARSFTVGALRRSVLRKGPLDEAGLALVVNGLSSDHRDYLAAGGYGFMIGDGRLRYGVEQIAELYYKSLVIEHIWLTGDYQFVANPAYNRDRGPVHVFGIRFHAEH
ncbi:MAG TPA: carbohydrate porin [Thermoanaerobaculia bacterium]